MTTTVQNVFADTLSTSTDDQTPDGSLVCETSPGTGQQFDTDTFTHSETFTSNWPGYDPNGPTNNNNPNKYVYQVQFNYTVTEYQLVVDVGNCFDQDGPRTLSTQNLGTDFYYRGSDTQAGAINTLPSTVSHTDTYTLGTDSLGGERNYNIYIDYTVDASWHWEGNLFSIDGVGGDSIEEISTQSTLTCEAGYIRGAEINTSSDAQVTCVGSIILQGEINLSSEFNTTPTSAVTHDFDISGITLTYTLEPEEYLVDDYVDDLYVTDPNYVVDGDSAGSDYVEDIVLTGVIQQQPSDAQLQVTAGFLRDSECDVESQTNFTGDAIVQYIAETDMSVQTTTTALAGNIIELGGANYHNGFVENDYTTPEDLEQESTDTQLTVFGTVILKTAEGVLEGESQINIQGGYLIGDATVLISADAEFEIAQNQGTIAGILFDGDSVMASQTQTTATPLYIRGSDVDIQADHQMVTTPGYLFSINENLITATDIEVESNILPGGSAIAEINSDITVVAGFAVKNFSVFMSGNTFKLTVAQYKIVDPFRTIGVKSETRLILAPFEQRVYQLKGENRVNKVKQEIRNYTVPQETREIKSQYLALARGTPVGSNERRIG